MPRTLLLASSGADWKPLLDGERLWPIVVLDPASSQFGEPACLRLVQEDGPSSWSFFGSLELMKAPHSVLFALSRFLRDEPDASVFFPALRPSPLYKQLLRQVLELHRPERILLQEGLKLAPLAWPIGPEAVPAVLLPEVVLHAQRRARWLKLMERSQAQEVVLSEVDVVGGRLGAGSVLGGDLVAKIGIPGAHVELCGPTLLIVSETHPDEHILSRALDLAHATKAVLQSPRSYENLACSLARDDGEELGLGFIRSFDLRRGSVTVISEAVPPVPAKILRLGVLKVDEQGRELEELRPWQA